MSEQDWKVRAEREAAALLAEATPRSSLAAPRYGYPDVLTLCAIAWLQGANYADHATLSAIEDAFDELRAAL